MKGKKVIDKGIETVKKVADKSVKGITKAKEYLIDDTIEDLNKISKKLEPKKEE